MEKNYSLSDIAALMNGNGGFGGGGIWTIFILFFVLFGGGWNRGYGADTGMAVSDLKSSIYASNDQQTLMSQVRGLGNGICDASYALNNTILTQSNGLQRDIMGGFNDNKTQSLQNTYAISSAIAENRFAAKESSCTTNRNIDAIRYENAQNTCAITRAIEQDGEKTRALIVQNKIDELQGKLAEKSQMLQTVQFELSQQAQNQTLIGALKPCPIPAYQVPNPYCNCNNGCGNY